MNIIYIHVCCINNYKDVFANLMHKIRDSGLYDHVHEIRCCILGDYDPNLFVDSKIKIRATFTELYLYETFTVNALYDDALRAPNDYNVLYLHTKGVTKPDNQNVKSWVEYMCYFNIYKWNWCTSLLQNYDTVGVNLQNEPVSHYSGNFWWARTSYIRKLDRVVHKEYNSPEFWLVHDGINRNLTLCSESDSNDIRKHVSLWNSNVDHYFNQYPKEKYENMPYSYHVHLS